jgi:tRNA uridine 5-carbamoylmethylation protein Kti12
MDKKAPKRIRARIPSTTTTGKNNVAKDLKTENMSNFTDLGKNMKVLCRLSESLCILNKTHFKEQLKRHLPKELINEIIQDENMLVYDSYGRTSCFHVVLANRRFIIPQPGSLMLASAI